MFSGKLASLAVELGTHVNERRQRTFQLVGRLGRGTTTEVNLCRLLGVQGFVKEVVVKRLLPQFSADAQLTARFLDEARRAARLSHPHIAHVFEVGENEHGPYVAMEYVRGVTLALVAARVHLARKLHYGHIARLMAGISDALAYVHDARDEDGEPLGPVHRHLSAANVIVSMEGVPKLIDVAPEPIGQQPVDQRADVFAVGATLYEVSTWRRPFADSPGTSNLVKPQHIVPGYPRALEDIVMAALERSPTPPCDSAAQLRDLLEEFASTPGHRSSPITLVQWLRELFPDFTSLTRASGWTLPPVATAPVAALTVPPSNPDQLVTPPAMLLTEDRLREAAAAVAPPRSRWGQSLRSGGAWKWTALAATAVAIGVIWATARAPTTPAPIAIPISTPDPELRDRVQQLEQELTRQQERAAAAAAPVIAEPPESPPVHERKALAVAPPARRAPVPRRGTNVRRHALAAPTGRARPPPAAPEQPEPRAVEVAEAPAPLPSPVVPPPREAPPAEVPTPQEPSAASAPRSATTASASSAAPGGLVRSSLTTGPVVSARPKDPVPIPSLPRLYTSADPEQVARVCQLVERAAVNLAAVSPEYARGVTGVLHRSLRPGSPIYPIAMYYFVVREAGLGHDQATAASNLAAAQRSGLILRYKDLPGIETNP